MNYEYCDGITYTIKKGDTLYEISRKHNVALALLLRANPYIDVFNLQTGDTICIPTVPQMPPSGTMGAPQMVSPENTDSQQLPFSGTMGNMQMMPTDATEDMQMPSADNDGFVQEGEELRQDTDEAKAEHDIAAGRWEKYVVQPGDTLEDVMRGMNGNAEKFLEKNSPAGIYMLPGVAYYIFMEEE